MAVNINKGNCCCCGKQKEDGELKFAKRAIQDPLNCGESCMFKITQD